MKKKCACGRTYTRAEWQALPHVGETSFEGEVPLEMRNCGCGSTLAINVLSKAAGRARALAPSLPGEGFEAAELRYVRLDGRAARRAPAKKPAKKPKVSTRHSKNSKRPPT